jgi:hypothetical protein
MNRKLIGLRHAPKDRDVHWRVFIAKDHPQFNDVEEDLRINKAESLRLMEPEKGFSNNLWIVVESGITSCFTLLRVEDCDEFFFRDMNPEVSDD